MPCELCGETVNKVGLNAAKNHTVIAIDAIISIGILVFQIARLRCQSVDGRQLAYVLALLHDADEVQSIERAKGLALTENLLIVRALDDIIRGTHVGDLVVIVSNIGRDCPIQMLPLDECRADG